MKSNERREYSYKGLADFLLSLVRIHLTNLLYVKYELLVRSMGLLDLRNGRPFSCSGLYFVEGSFRILITLAIL